MCFAKNLHLLQATRKIHVKINHVKKLTKFVHDFRNLLRYKTEKSENQAVIGHWLWSGTSLNFVVIPIHMSFVISAGDVPMLLWAHHAQHFTISTP